MSVKPRRITISNPGRVQPGVVQRPAAPQKPAEPPRRRKRRRRRGLPLWLPFAVTMVLISIVSGMVVYAMSLVEHIEDSIRPDSEAPSIAEEVQTLEAYRGDILNVLICGIDYEEGRDYGTDGTNDGMTDMIMYAQFDIKGGKLNMLQIPRNSLVTTRSRRVSLSNGKNYQASNYQINSVMVSSGGIAALAEVIYDQFRLPIDHYITIDMEAFKDIVNNFGGIEVYIPREMSFAGSRLLKGYRNLDGDAAEFFVRCRHGVGYENADLDRLNMQRYFYAGLFKRARSMNVQDILNQLPVIFGSYIRTDMDLITLSKLVVSFLRIDSANIMLAQTPVFMGVPNIAQTETFAGYSCVLPDARSISELLNTYFRPYSEPVSEKELHMCTNDWPHSGASTSANVQFIGQLNKESDDAILAGDTDVSTAVTTDGERPDAS